MTEPALTLRLRRAGWLRALSGAVDRPTLSRWGRVLAVEAAGVAHELFRPGVW